MLSISVVVDNKHLRGHIKDPSRRKLGEEWVKKGMLYRRPNGSNDDWYISKLY